MIEMCVIEENKTKVYIELSVSGKVYSRRWFVKRGNNIHRCGISYDVNKLKRTN